MNIHLSPRLKEAFVLLGQGLSNKQIAQKMGITEGTVKSYVDKIYLKCQLTYEKDARRRIIKYYNNMLQKTAINLNEKLGDYYGNK